MTAIVFSKGAPLGNLRVLERLARAERKRAGRVSPELRRRMQRLHIRYE